MAQHDPQQSTDIPVTRERPTYRVLFWIVLLGLLVAVQWPMFKGAYYRAVGKVPPNNIPWRADYESALAESRQTGKPVLIDFTAGWCPPCQVMLHDVWPDERVRQAVEKHAIPLMIDVDDSATHSLQVRYGIDSIPTILLVDGEGRVLKNGAFMSSRGLIDFLTEPHN